MKEALGPNMDYGISVEYFDTVVSSSRHQEGHLACKKNLTLASPKGFPRMSWYAVFVFLHDASRWHAKFATDKVRC